MAHAQSYFLMILLAYRYTKESYYRFRGRHCGLNFVLVAFKEFRVEKPVVCSGEAGVLGVSGDLVTRFILGIVPSASQSVLSPPDPPSK